MHQRVTRHRRGLRHAVRGPAPRRAGPGDRWPGRPRPLLVGPPLDTVLLRRADPLVVHDHRFHLVVRPALTVTGNRTSVHPVVRTVERVTTRTAGLGPARVERPSSGRAARPAAGTLPGAALRHKHRPDDRPDRAGPRPPTGPRAALALATPPRHLVARGATSSTPTAGPAPSSAMPAYSPAHTPSFARSSVGVRHPAAPPAPALTGPAESDAGTRDRGPTARTAPVDVDDLTRRVVDAIDRRLVSHRERLGRR